ncbi:hypothetical protein, partial [Neisseria bergeri]|uniref:hypothetical protein n=1 Tax=Neisseria bergeri TaxID=1906581 RepID=UPI00272D744D
KRKNNKAAYLLIIVKKKKNTSRLIHIGRLKTWLFVWGRRRLAAVGRILESDILISRELLVSDTSIRPTGVFQAACVSDFKISRSRRR